MSPEDLVGVLFEALHAEHGLLLRVSDPEQAKQALYAARRRFDEGGELRDLMFTTIDHPEGNLRVARRSAVRGERAAQKEREE